jgi:hypothetical protein
MTLINKGKLESVDIEGYDNLNILRVENSIINPFTIMSKCNNLEFVRFIDIDCQANTSNIQTLMNCKGMSEDGVEIPIAQAVTGKITLSQCSKDMEVEFKEAFPYVEFTVLEYIQSFTVKFVDGDGNVLYTQKVLQNGEAKYVGKTPTKKSTAQYDYTFKGWDRLLKPITSDTTITATFNSVLRYYTIRFINSDTQEVVSSQYLAYGSTPTTPALPEGAYSWTPTVTKVICQQDYYSSNQIPYPEDLSIFNFSAVTINGVSGYSVSLKTSITMPSTVIFPYKYNDKPVLEIKGSNVYNSTYQGVITEVYIPETVVKLREYAFKYFGIKQIDLPNITSLGYNCFDRCTSLTTIDLPLVTSLGNNCFQYCTSLTTIDLPKATSLESDCFGSCSKLTLLTLGGVSSPITNTSNFSTTALSTYVKTLNIYVENASNPPTLTGSPWGARNATIYYKQA